MSKRKIITPAQAAEEYYARLSAQDSLIDFTRYTKPGYVVDPAHRMIAEHLEKVESGEIQRLMIFAPPRHGKSELSTRRFPAWYLGRNPRKTIISASYGADFARGFGRDVRDIIACPEYGRVFPDVAIRADNRAAEEWAVGQGGTYFSVGVSSPTTGRGAHLFLIDDPVKDRKEADSATYRESLWAWYRDVAYTRLEETGAIVMTLTRWHYDDLAGRCLELMESGRGKPWTVLTLPALPDVRYTASGEPILNDDGTVPGDPMGRKVDEPLAPQRLSLAALKDFQQTLGERSWVSMYQQKPMSEDKGFFREPWFSAYDGAQLDPNRIQARAWDLAASTSGDYTVGVKMSKSKAGTFLIEDVIRFRGSPLQVESKILETARRDGRACQIVIPQDPGQAGTDQAQSYIRKLAGYKVKAKRPTGDKETRAAAFAAQAEGRQVQYMPAASWWQDFIDELVMFPIGTNDDQVDAASDAFNALLAPARARILNW